MLQLSPDGRVVATGGTGQVLKLWDLEGTVRLIATGVGHSRTVRGTGRLLPGQAKHCRGAGPLVCGWGLTDTLLPPCASCCCCCALVR